MPRAVRSGLSRETLEACTGVGWDSVQVGALTAFVRRVLPDCRSSRGNVSHPPQRLEQGKILSLAAVRFARRSATSDR
jgi:hypothetical protein